MYEERLYIGCKIIKAVPMTKDEFYREKQQPYEGENAPGYEVTYPDGYVSWSPKWTFENAYRPITDQEKNFMNPVSMDKTESDRELIQGDAESIQPIVRSGECRPEDPCKP